MQEGLVRRVCPVCGADEPQTVLTLTAEDFVHNNSTYILERIPELGLDPATEYPIVACGKCEMVYTQYHLEFDRLDIVYERLIDPEKSLEKVMRCDRRIVNHRDWIGLLQLVARQAPGALDLKVMDYGCGWATMLGVAKGPGVDVVGFDVTPWKVEWAREQGIPIVESEAELAARGPFDLAICTSCIEHLTEPRLAVDFIAAHLKHGGYAFLTCIVHEVMSLSDWAQMRRRLADKKPLPKDINPWEHLNYFNNQTYRRFLDESGFEPVPTPSRLLTEQSGPREAARMAADFLQWRTAAVRVGQTEYWRRRSE